MQIENLPNRIVFKLMLLLDFLREVVWKRQQATELMGSLYNGHLIRGPLTWDPESLPDIRTMEYCTMTHD